MGSEVIVDQQENMMIPRLNYLASPTAREVIKHVMSMSQVLKNSALDGTLRELVSLRVSQINGCAVCIDMHTKEAAAAGEEAVRLNLVAAWREATVFTEAERAALEFAEQGTRVADGADGVSDEVWANAAKHFDEEQLNALVILVAMMNTVNRLNIITRQPAGTYEVGQFH